MNIYIVCRVRHNLRFKRKRLRPFSRGSIENGGCLTKYLLFHLKISSKKNDNNVTFKSCLRNNLADFIFFFCAKVKSFCHDANYCQDRRDRERDILMGFSARNPFDNSLFIKKAAHVRN